MKERVMGGTCSITNTYKSSVETSERKDQYALIVGQYYNWSSREKGA
jgi:hypothetical protein